MKIYFLNETGKNYLKQELAENLSLSEDYGEVELDTYLTASVREINQCDWSENRMPHLEIPAMHSKSKRPVVIDLNLNNDFDYLIEEE